MWARKWLDAPAFYVSERDGAAGMSLYLYVQATRHWLLFGGAAPNGPIDYLDSPRVAAGVGTSWTFDNGLEVTVSAGTYNVVARRPWDQTIPSDSYSLALRSWL